MKRTLILRYYAFIALGTYLFSLFYYFLTSGTILPLWFSFACLLLAIYSILRSIFFYLDSALWLGIFIFSTALINILQFLEPITGTQTVALYFFAGAVSSVSVAVIYKSFPFIKISFVLTLEVILILLYSIGIINVRIFFIFNFTLVSFLLISIVYHFKKLMSNYNKQKNKQKN